MCFYDVPLSFSLFGGGGMQGGKRKGPDYRMEFPVSLEDLYNGVSAK
jgi:DnaJ-class molecular chaperone